MEGSSTRGADTNSVSPSSDLGSSCDSASSDAKSNTKLGSDDVISVDGSASLTLDSLEEEEEEEAEDDSKQTEEKRVENDGNVTTPANLNRPEVTSDSDRACQCQRDDTGEESAMKTESCQDKGHLSDLAVHGSQNKASGSKPAKPSRKTLPAKSDSQGGSASACDSDTKESETGGEAKTCDGVRSALPSGGGGQGGGGGGNDQEAAGDGTGDKTSAPEATGTDNSEPSESRKTTTVGDWECEEPEDGAASRCSRCGEVGNSARKPASGPTDSTPEPKPGEASEHVVVVVADGSNCEESSTDPEPQSLSANCRGDLETAPSPASPHHHHHHHHHHPHSTQASPRRAPTSLSLRKTRSMTETSDPCSPGRTAGRPSGIPRRKSSAGDQPQPACCASSARTTPQQSPASRRRSLPLGSASRNSFRQASPRSADSSPGSAAPASFPQTPVKVKAGGRLKRSASHQDNVSNASSCLSTPLSRDTVTSRLRFEMHHQDHDRDPLDKADAYLTPYQRKDLLINDLRAQLKDLNKQLDDWQRHDLCRREEMEEEKEQMMAKLQADVDEARTLRDLAQQEVTSLKESHEQSVKTVATLQQELEKVKKEMASQMSQAEDIFLEMYKKGRESAIFEREEELELQGKGKRSPDATETDLRNKLERTQAELAKWQTLQRHESYHTSLMPGTEAETTLRFLKDAVFHYLTADRKACDEHLRAIVRILRFSDVQREKIAYSIIHRRNKSGW